MNADNSFLDDIAAKTIQKIQKNKVISDPITFAQASWGLGYSFLPAQKFITKCIYHMPLDDQEKYIPLKDQFAQKTIDNFTQVQFLQYLIKQKRTNIVSLDWYNQRVGKQRYNQVILCAGRRASKCFDQDFQILTNYGFLTAKKILQKYQKGQQLYLNTYNLDSGKITFTNKIKVQNNGIQQCLKIKCSNGFFNITTKNHPFLVYDYLTQKIQFVQADKLKPKDVLVCSNFLNYNNDKYNFFSSIKSYFAALCGKFDYKGKKNFDFIKRGSKKQMLKFLFLLFGDVNYKSFKKSLSEQYVSQLQNILLIFGIKTKINKIEKSFFGKKYILFDLQPCDFFAYSLYLQKVCSLINKRDVLELKKSDICLNTVQSVQSVGQKNTIAIEVQDTHIIATSIITHNSNLSSVIANYQVYRLIQKKNPQSYYGFPKGEQVFFTCASVDADGATDLLNKMRSKLMNCAPMRDKIVGDSVDYLTMQTDNDIQVYGKRRGVPTIKINTGACSSNGLRGKNNIMVILDQVAFFSATQSSKFSGTEIYNALTPSCASFKRKGATNEQKGDGLVFLISSPAKQQGIFWQTYQNSFKLADDILMFKMGTSMVNPYVDSNYLKMQYKKNPQTFDIEYNANFSTKTLKFIGNKQQLHQCVDKNRLQNQSGGIQGNDYFMAIDLAYKNDATAIAIVHKEKDIYIVDYVNAFFPGSSDVWQIPNSIYKCYNQFADHQTLSINLINDIIVGLCKKFPIKKGTYDQWSGGFALQQLLYEQGLQRIEMNSYGPVVNSITWDLFQTLMRDKKINFWNCQPLIAELLDLQYQVSRNNKKVFAPKQQGCHDDMSDAVARAIHLCYNSTQKVTKKVTSGVGFGINRHSTQSAISYNLSRWNKIKMHGGVASRDAQYQQQLRRRIR